MDSNNKYYDLFLIAKETLEQERIRYNRIDDKIHRLLNLTTLFVGLASFYGKWIIDHFIPSHSVIEWIVFIFSATLYLTLLYTWFIIIHADRLYDSEAIPINEDMRAFFKENESVDIYYGLTKNYEEALNKNRSQTEKKIKYLNRSHLVLKFSLAILIIIAILFLNISWN